MCIIPKTETLNRISAYVLSGAIILIALFLCVMIGSKEQERKERTDEAGFV